MRQSEMFKLFLNSTTTLIDKYRKQKRFLSQGIKEEHEHVFSSFYSTLLKLNETRTMHNNEKR